MTKHNPTEDSEIRLKGHLDTSWASWFDDMTITLTEDGDQLLAGTLLSIHNLRSLIRLVEDIRGYITDGTYEEQVPVLLKRWDNNAKKI